MLALVRVVSACLKVGARLVRPFLFQYSRTSEESPLLSPEFIPVIDTIVVTAVIADEFAVARGFS